MKKLLMFDNATGVKLFELTPEGVTFLYVVEAPPPIQDQVTPVRSQADDLYLEAIRKLSTP